MAASNTESNVKVVPNIPKNAKWSQNGTTVAGGRTTGSVTNQLYYPWGLDVDDNGTVYVADWGNHRIMAWGPGAERGRIVAGGSDIKLWTRPSFGVPINVLVDKETHSLLVCDHENHRLVRWPLTNRMQGEILIQSSWCRGLAMDDKRFLYVSDTNTHEVRRYRMGEKNGTVVAGGNGPGAALNQFNCPKYVFVDQDYSIYVSDFHNHRVMKWLKDAKEGTVVARIDRGSGPGWSSGPRGIFVDLLGTLYVADSGNHRVMRWYAGETQGEVIVGGNGPGDHANQLIYPDGLSFDRHGNLYVVDYGNHRVQRFSIE